MTKADLINLIAEKAGITRVKSETVVNTIFDSMVEALMKLQLNPHQRVH